MAAGHRHRVLFTVVVVSALSALLSGPTIAARQGPAAAAPAVAASPALNLSLAQQEEFLKTARVVRTRGASKGVTNTLRATLSDGTLTHDASIQTVDEEMREFRGTRGTELNFKDSWRFNVAAYRIDRLLEIGMIPPSVERRYNGKLGAFTWWVDDVLMDEAERYKTKAPAPDPDAWNRQMWTVRLFDQLIANVDRNLGNLLIDKSWTIWMIDHSRSFRLNDKIRAPENLSRCDRQLFERLKALDLKALQSVARDYLTPGEMRAMLARRDDIVARIEKLGPAGLFDRVPQQVPQQVRQVR
jgi:hypothetical protein